MSKKEEKNLIAHIGNAAIYALNVNEKDKQVTAVSRPAAEYITARMISEGIARCNASKENKARAYEKLKELTSEPKIVKARCAEGDEFDPYVGAALALVYTAFGSRTKFIKYVDSWMDKKPEAKKPAKKAVKSVKKGVVINESKN